VSTSSNRERQSELDGLGSAAAPHGWSSIVWTAVTTIESGTHDESSERGELDLDAHDHHLWDHLPMVTGDHRARGKTRAPPIGRSVAAMARRHRIVVQGGQRTSACPGGGCAARGVAHHGTSNRDR
jgi:hypothetical protein